MVSSADELIDRIIAVSNELMTLLAMSSVESTPESLTQTLADQVKPEKTSLEINISQKSPLDKNSIAKNSTDLSSTPADNSVIEQNLSKLTTERDKLIRQLFTQFDPEELQLKQAKLNKIKNLDKILGERANESFHRAKNAILAAKKNKKAINSYQSR